MHYGPPPYEGRGALSLLLTAPMDQVRRRPIMAKGQKRSSSNREIRKPKAKKPPVVGAPSTLSAKGMLAPTNILKKKS